MLKSENRIKRIQKNKNEKTYKSPYFNIRISKGQDYSKFGFIVSKKVSKSAVVRNRTKRVLADAAKKLLSEIEPEKNIIIISKNVKLYMPQLAAVFNCKQYVADASNSLWKIDKWKKDCEQLLLRCHSVPEEGAFILSL